MPPTKAAFSSATLSGTGITFFPSSNAIPLTIFFSAAEAKETTFAPDDFRFFPNFSFSSLRYIGIASTSECAESASSSGLLSLLFSGSASIVAICSCRDISTSDCKTGSGFAASSFSSFISLTSGFTSILGGFSGTPPIFAKSNVRTLGAFSIWRSVK